MNFGETIPVRLSQEMVQAIVSWAARQSDDPTRSEAIRRLVELGLTVKQSTKTNPHARADTSQRALKAAEAAIDAALSAASDDMKADRKHKLTTLPKGLRR